MINKKFVNYTLCSVYLQKVTFIIKWCEENTLKDFQQLLQAAFENASKFLTLRTVDCSSLHKFVCTTSPSILESLKRMYIEKERFFRQQGVVAMIIGDNILLLVRGTRSNLSMSVQVQHSINNTYILWIYIVTNLYIYLNNATNSKQSFL